MNKGISILIVDDEKNLRDILLRILGREGYAVDAAVDSDDALRKLETHSYHLVVSDLDMPRTNGYELLRVVKQKHPDIGVIMMIGHGDLQAVKASLLLGADEYITKPFKSFEINLVVERAYWRQHSITRSQS